MALILAATTTLLIGTVAVSAAQDQSSSIGLILERAPQGSLVELARVDVAPELVGRDCVLDAAVYNQRSVNPGNDVIVSTGGTQVTLIDVEPVRDITTSGSSPVVAGDQVVFTLRMGPSEVFSAALSMTLDCPPPPSTTTTTTTTTTTVAAAYDEVVTTTTTTAEPPTEVIDIVAAQPAVPVVNQPTFTG